MRSDDPLILTGDSHVIACLQAAVDMGLTDRIKGTRLGGAGIYEERFFEWDGKSLRPANPAVQKTLRRHAGLGDLAPCRRQVVLSLGLGAAHFYKQFASGYDFGPKADPTGRFVSQQVIDTMIRDMQRFITEFLTICIELDLLVAAIAAPRPQRRHGSAVRLGPRLLELVAMYQAPIRKMLGEAGCPIIEPPEAVDPEGFLRKEYWGTDPSHANAGYGRLVIDALLRIERGRRAPPDQVRMDAETPAPGALRH